MESLLEQTLLGCSQPNTEVIRASEAALKKQLVGSQSIPPLVQLIRFSQHQSVRQLASVLLRVKLGTLNWMKLPVEQQEACKQTLLESVLAEQTRQIRICNCYAVATLAKSQFAQPGGWPQLLELIRHTTTATSGAQQEDGAREIGFLLMYTLTESLVTYFPQSIPEFVAIFRSALESSSSSGGGSSSRVVLAVLRATTSMIECVSEEEEVMAFQPLVPLLLNALAASSSTALPSAADEEFHVSTMVQIIETIGELVDSSQPILPDRDLAGVCQVLAQLAAAPRSSSQGRSIRAAAATALSDIVSEKTRFVAKHQPTRECVLQACFQLCRDATTTSSGEGGEDGEDEDDDDEEEAEAGGGEMSTAEMAEMLVTAYATSLPTKLVVDTLLHAAAGMVQQQQNDKEREAGLVALIIASEGMAVELVEDSAYAAAFESLLQLVLQCVHDHTTRGTLRHSLLLLGQWAEHLWPLMEPHAERVLGLGVRYMALSPGQPRIFTPACYVVQQYCSAMEEDDLAPYVQGIVTPVFHFFAQVRLEERTASVYTSAVETLSYVCTSAGGKFGPHFDHALSIIAPLMNVQGEEDYIRRVRSHATALMGQLAFVSTQCTPKGQPNPFFVFVPELLNKCFALLQQDKKKQTSEDEEEGEDDEDLDFKDSAHHLFANVARALQTDVEPFLPQILHLLMRDCVSNDGDVVQTQRNRDGDAFAVTDSIKQLAMEQDGGGGGAHSHGDDDGDEDDNAEEDDPSVKLLTSVREAAADSKASAFSALETLCEIYVNSPLDHVQLQQRCCIAPQVQHILIDLCGKTLDEYLHPGVRKCAVSCLGGVLLLAFRAEAPRPTPSRADRIAYATSTLKDADMDCKWLPGQQARAHSFPETCRLAQEVVLPYLIESMTCDSDKEVAAEACNVLERVVTYSGLTLVAGMIPDLCDALLTLLEGRGVCQSASEQVGDDDEEDEEARRHDEILLDSVGEALVAVCKAMGRDALQPILGANLVPSLLKRSKPTMPTKDRITTVGCLSMLITFAGTVGSAGNVKQYKNKLLNVALESIRQNDDACLRRNGLVLLGVLLERNAEMQLNPMDCLDQVMFLFAAGGGGGQKKSSNGPQAQPRKWEAEDHDAVLDNACSVVAKALKLGAPPLPDAARRAVAGELLKHLPLRFDHEEDWAVYSSVQHVLPLLDDASVAGAVVPVVFRALMAVDQTGTEELLLGATQQLVALGDLCAHRMGGAVPQEFAQVLGEVRQVLARQVDLRVV